MVLKVGSLEREARPASGSSHKCDVFGTKEDSEHHGSGTKEAQTSCSSHMTPMKAKRMYAEVVRGGSGDSLQRNQPSIGPPVQVCRNFTRKVEHPKVGTVFACTGAAQVARKSRDLPVLPEVTRPNWGNSSRNL